MLLVPMSGRRRDGKPQRSVNKRIGRHDLTGVQYSGQTLATGVLCVRYGTGTLELIYQSYYLSYVAQSPSNGVYNEYNGNYAGYPRCGS
jgi:hypothetical protein